MMNLILVMMFSMKSFTQMDYFFQLLLGNQGICVCSSLSVCIYAKCIFVECGDWSMYRHFSVVYSYNQHFQPCSVAILALTGWPVPEGGWLRQREQCVAVVLFTQVDCCLQPGRGIK